MALRPSHTSAQARQAFTADTLARWLQVLIEPAHGPLNHVAAVRWIGEFMAFVWINDELGGHTRRFQRVPEFVGLRRRAFPVAIAYDHQRRRLHIFDKRDGRALRVHCRIVVDICAEKRWHPLVDFVLAVIAQPVGKACACHSGAEAIRLRNSPHGHVAAIAPAGKTDPLGIDWSGFYSFVHSRHDVAEITVTKILHVGGGKFFSLAVTPAWIRLEHEVALRRQRHSVFPPRGPRWSDGPRRTAVPAHNQRILLPGIEVAWVRQPALHFANVGGPMQAHGFTPRWTQPFISLGNLLPLSCFSGPHFRGLVK